MYRYEELNLKELQIDPDISLESPEALYAMAQCYRLGKGTEIDIEHYQDYLQAAMEAGSAMAREEWEQLNNGTAVEEEPDIPEPEQEDISRSSLSELMKRLEKNDEDIRVHYEIYRRFYKLSPEEAFGHLEKAVKLAEQVGESSDYTLCQEIFLEIGMYYEEHGEGKKSSTFYGRAAELGSQRANTLLANYYEKKADSNNWNWQKNWEEEEDEEEESTEQILKKSIYYREKGLKGGTDWENYMLGEAYYRCGQSINGRAVFERLLQKDNLDRVIRVLCELRHHPEKTQEEVIRAAWQEAESPEVIQRIYDSYYKGKTGEIGNIPEELLSTAEQAFLLGKCEWEEKKKCGAWMKWAADRGSNQAADCLEKEKEENRIRREREVWDYETRTGMTEEMLKEIQQEEQKIEDLSKTLSGLKEEVRTKSYLKKEKKMSVLAKITVAIIVLMVAIFMWSIISDFILSFKTTLETGNWW